MNQDQTNRFTDPLQPMRSWLAISTAAPCDPPRRVEAWGGVMATSLSHRDSVATTPTAQGGRVFLPLFWDLAGGFCVAKA